MIEMSGMDRYKGNVLNDHQIVGSIRCDGTEQGTKSFSAWRALCLRTFLLVLSMAFATPEAFSAKQEHIRDEAADYAAINQKIFDLIDSLKSEKDINRENFETHIGLTPYRTLSEPENLMRSQSRKTSFYYGYGYATYDWIYTFNVTSSANAGSIGMQITQSGERGNLTPQICPLDINAVMERMQAAGYTGKYEYIGHPFFRRSWIYDREKIRVSFSYSPNTLIAHGQHSDCVYNVNISPTGE